ncbi:MULTISPECIES: hypothetical protein [Streptomyces]|uniref:STAS domain-containing protein n=1 Tax=Streptomyces griseosporeus TaxID=1910 RepID=A0ABV3KWU2_STRGS
MLVDLGSVEFFDCSGLRVLCRAEARGGERLLPLPALTGGDA